MTRLSIFPRAGARSRAAASSSSSSAIPILYRRLYLARRRGLRCCMVIRSRLSACSLEETDDGGGADAREIGKRLACRWSSMQSPRWCTAVVLLLRLHYTRGDGGMRPSRRNELELLRLAERRERSVNFEPSVWPYFTSSSLPRENTSRLIASLAWREQVFSGVCSLPAGRPRSCGNTRAPRRSALLESPLRRSQTRVCRRAACTALSRPRAAL